LLWPSQLLRRSSSPSTWRGDRRRDDARRQEDRERDSELRKEGRQYDEARRREDRENDAEQRGQDRERADRLRREDDQKWESRFRAEQRDREDYEARQVTIELVPGGALSQAQRASTPGHDYTHQIVISAPASYGLKQVDAQIVHNSNGNLALRPTGHRGDPPVTEHGRTVVRMWAEMPGQLFEPVPIIRFVDRHGNLYYSYRQRTQRFPENTDWIKAAAGLDLWNRTGPKPNDPDEP